MRSIFLASALYVGVFSSAAWAECDSASVEADIQDRFSSRIASTEGVCNLATLQIEILEAAKDGFSACLMGQSLQDVLDELDRAIDRARQARRDVCG